MSQSKKLRWVAGSLGALALTSLGVWLQLRVPGSVVDPRATSGDGRDGPSSSAGRSPTRSDDAASPLEKRGLQYAVGFDILLDSGGDSGESSHLAGSGTLNLLEVGPDEKGTRWVGFVSDAGGAMDMPGATTHASSGLATEMQSPFTFVVSPKGTVEGIGFREAEKFRGHSIVRAMVAALQFVGGESGAKSWATEETDSTGRCNVSYAETSPDHYTKTKTECPFLLATSSSALKMKGELESTTKYELDGQRVVLKLAAEETLTLKFPQGGQASTGAKLDMTLSGRSGAKNPYPDYRSWPLGPLYGKVQKPREMTPEENLAAKKELLAGATYPDLSSGLDEAIEKDDSSARNREFVRMSALFELEPSSIERAGEQLRQDIETSKAEALVAALADSRSPAAQHEMNELMKDPSVEEHVKHHVLNHMGLHEEPSLETFDTLADVAQNGEDPDMRAGATLALGGAARRGLDGDETREAATQTTESLEKAYDQAQTPEERAVVMAALGNAGAKTSLTQIQKALQSEDPETRGDAVFSLRFVEGEEAEKLIATVVTTDPVAAVRRSAVETFGYRDWTPILEAAALDAYQNDESKIVRTAVITFLSAGMPNLGAQGRETLQLATQDEDEEVSKIAMAALDPGEDPSAPGAPR